SNPATTTFSTLTCEMQVEIRSTNWMFRKVARHDPWAETGMSAAMVWVVARAVALRAESTPAIVPFRPRVAIQPPVAAALDGAHLAAAGLEGLRRAGVLASIRRAPNGRLAWSSVAIQVTGSPRETAARLSTPETWSVFPGWKSVKRIPASTSKSQSKSPPPPDPLLIAVEDDISLVDLDAVWALSPMAPGRATAVEGDIRGAVFAWQAWPGDDLRTTTAVLSMHPRLDAAGFIERKLVAAEPLLEHAFSIALSYVDAAAIADDFTRRFPSSSVR
ncbi:MAG: hypothetical protein H7X95_13450, partial [Deltaproteobacteria bacterium]|nr:hypothetical protein [Deltaproteobacteria bacterium]